LVEINVRFVGSGEFGKDITGEPGDASETIVEAVREPAQDVNAPTRIAHVANAREARLDAEYIMVLPSS
jgi:hypothetical protein